MEECRIFKTESFSCVDGEGIRFVVFMSGCDFRCGFCHNPEGWDCNFGDVYTPKSLAHKITKYLPYLKNGGVTFSGGEPLQYAKFIVQVMNLLEEYNIDFAVETSGNIYNFDVAHVLSNVSHIMFDIKGVDSQEYAFVTGKDAFCDCMNFLSNISNGNSKVWLRYVVMQGFNDDEVHMKKLNIIKKKYNIERVQLLPFHKMCKDKYTSLKIPFRFEKFETPNNTKIKYLEALANE